MQILAYLQIGLCLFCASPAVNKDILEIIPIFKGRFCSRGPAVSFLSICPTVDSRTTSDLEKLGGCDSSLLSPV